MATLLFWVSHFGSILAVWRVISTLYMELSKQLGMTRKRIGPIMLALFPIFQKSSFLPTKSVPCDPYALHLSHKGHQLLRVTMWWPLCEGPCFTPKLVLVVEADWNTINSAEFRTLTFGGPVKTGRSRVNSEITRWFTWLQRVLFHGTGYCRSEGWWQCLARATLPMRHFVFLRYLRTPLPSAASSLALPQLQQ